MIKEADPDKRFLKTLVVLYAEDDDEVRRQFVELLQRRVREVLPARDGAEALALFREKRPDLVITDIRMPAMDGLSLAKAIREEAPATPVIVTTAFDQTEYLVRAIDIGVEQYLMKPVERSLLDARLLACVRRLRVEAEAAKARDLEVEMGRARALRLLAGGLAHDYNNLLQAILGNVALAREVLPADNAAEEMLRDAESAALEAKGLSQQLLALAEKTTVGKGPTDVESAVRTALGEVLSDSRITVAIQAARDCPRAQIGADVVQAVVRQLGTNAREAMPNGGALRVTIEVTEGLSPADPPRVHMAFQDTGRGVAEEDLARIFDPYFTTKPRGSQRGTGLGLSVVQALLQRYGGAISVTSKEGEGATFDVWLPVAATSS
ncbi:MAG: response regulator [Polyangiaceae bacterium]